MAGRPRKITTKLEPDELETLNQLAISRTADTKKVQRAAIILMLLQGKTNEEIATAVKLSKPSVANTIKKFNNYGAQAALEDGYRSGRPNIINREDKSWVINLACTCPQELSDGPKSGQWSLSSLADYVRKHCKVQGHPNLSKVSKSQIHAILNDNSIKPYKITYYLDKKDEKFEKKADDVLLVYMRIAGILQFTKSSDAQGKSADVTCGDGIILHDEKLRIGAAASITADLPSNFKPGGAKACDCEHQRDGTLVFLAGIDLFSGEIMGIVRKKHSGAEFIEFLQMVDEKYPKELSIKIILDDLNVHTGKQVLNYLAERPGRFDFTLTPIHGSWLNLVESMFERMAKLCLRDLRADNRQELADHIIKWMEQYNEQPETCRWKWNPDEIRGAFAKREIPLN